MNYEIPQPRESEVEYNIDVAMRYGDLPSSILMAKYEETDIGPDEDVYDNYARGVLVDQRPDSIMTAADEPRGRVNASSGRLQLQYYGHRGNAEPPSHPEMFLGFTDQDPRGHAVDPDMKLLRRQHDARMRFVNWTPDQSDHITGGGRSEGQLMKDQQTLFKWTKDRLKVFSRSLDGRREGLRKTWKHCSAKARQDAQAKYGNHMGSDTQTPQRRANIVKKALRDCRAFRDDNLDQDLSVSKYTQLGRRNQTKNTQQRLHVTSRDGEFKDADQSKCFKTVGILMNQIVKQRTTMQKTVTQDIDYGATVDTQIRKHEDATRDLALILRSIVTQNDFKDADMSMTVKTKAPVPLQHLANVVSLNHLLPAHHYINAELMYKSVLPGKDTRKTIDMIVDDANKPTIQDVKSVFGRSARMHMVSGGKTKGTSDIVIHEGTRTTHNYRHALAVNGDRRIRLHNAENFAKESDNTIFGRTNHKQHRITQASDTVQTVNYGDNAYQERFTAPMGDKAGVRRGIDRESDRGMMSEVNGKF